MSDKLKRIVNLANDFKKQIEEIADMPNYNVSIDISLFPEEDNRDIIIEAQMRKWYPGDGSNHPNPYYKGDYSKIFGVSQNSSVHLYFLEFPE